MKTTLGACLLLALLAACQSPPKTGPEAFLALGIRDSFTPMAGVYCSGQPTEAQFAQLEDVGVARVVTLRVRTEEGSGWEEAKAKELGIELVRIPVDGEAGITLDNAKAMAEQVASSPGPVLVLCNSSNRVGALFALKARFLDGKTPAEAIAVGKACGLRKAEPLVTSMVSK